ncbi:hypothetical protein [Luteococcus peritonei]|uniref:Type II secretion system protein GspF domain-containing protein n=1 Tax=Luteococcus peritonei TaxID=88874 RepID=A0ABW4RT46_9ACTN
MVDPLVVVVTASGLLLSLGLVLVVAGLRDHPVSLTDALDSLDGAQRAGGPTGREMVDEEDLAGRIGALAFTRLRLPLADEHRRLLALQGRSIGDFFAEKLLLATLGLVAPLLLTAVLQGLGALVAPLPVGLGIALALLGWFWPGLTLHRGRERGRSDAGEALFTFFDLVVLERLANASAAQAMMSAASLSDSPLYVRLRTCLERARLEQRPPWQELNRLSHELDLPQIADMADVMRLDEQGAALAEALRARVRELRDAHLLAEKLEAQKVSERMTVWMVVPSMVFGLVFLTPPVLKLLGVDQ